MNPVKQIFPLDETTFSAWTHANAITEWRQEGCNQQRHHKTPFGTYLCVVR